MHEWQALPFLTGIFFSTTKETKGHKGKKAKKHPLCTSPALHGMICQANHVRGKCAPGASVVTLRGKVFPPETEEPSGIDKPLGS